jgi:predicted acylesterase/phospholipase RssA
MKYLILSPGSLGFYTLLGYLTKIEHELDEVEEISGASAGAILGFLLLSKYSLKEILDVTLPIDLEELTKVDLKTFINSFGFINHELIKQKLIEIWGGNPTFSELPKKLHISAYCLNTLEVEYFSRDTHPDMRVTDAVCASISIPILFAAYDFNGKKYTDGGTSEYIPVMPFLHKNFSDVMCVLIHHNSTECAKLDNILDYFLSLALSAYKHRRTYDNVPTKLLDVSHMNILDFKASLETRLKLFMIGHGA